MNILDTIIAHKKKEVEQRKRMTPVSTLEKSPYFESAPLSMKKFLTSPDRTGIIAEFKRRSPSKGVINANARVEEVTQTYDQGGASAISVLTDIDFFGGADEDLLHAREVVNCPLLRKEFIIDEYQILEARSLGANIILLIAAVLKPEELKRLAEFTKSLQMEVLLEVHDEFELLDNCCDPVDAVGVNNRNLKDFSVTIETSVKLSEIIPKKYLKVSESGIHDAETILRLKEHGFDGFLIGENFMKQADPGKAFMEFSDRLKKLQLEQLQSKTKLK